MNSQALLIHTGENLFMSDAFICDVIRTPFGRYGGALSSVRADDLAAIPIKVLGERNPSVDLNAIDDVILGCANQAGEDNRNVARMALLLAGLPQTVPGTTVNRLCGSSMDAIAIAARAIKTGENSLIIAGGVESMSRAPFVMGKSDSAFSRAMKLEDTTMGWRFVNPAMKTLYGTDSMPETGENVAEEFAVSREDQDAFAYRSQQRAAAAMKSGILAEEITPVTITPRKGPPITIDQDEHPRADTTLEALSALKPVVKSNGTITAGNASGINDGACAVLMASEEAVKRYGLKPKARVLASAVAGVAPRIMGVGPVPAARKALVLAGLTIAETNIVELNEAFASQALAVLRELEIADDASYVNPNGGAIAIGHPLGASGARLVGTAALQLQRTGGRYALCTMCIGVGQGIAMVLERV
jgi:acetyl-CoA acyltransferase